MHPDRLTPLPKPTDSFPNIPEWQPFNRSDPSYYQFNVTEDGTATANSVLSLDPGVKESASEYVGELGRIKLKLAI